MSVLANTCVSKRYQLDKKTQIEKFALFMIFGSICSYLIYPNLLLSLSLTEIFCFLGVCPEPKIFKNDKKKLNKIFIPGIAGILLLFVLLTNKFNMVPLVLLMLFLAISTISIKSLKLGTHWLANVSAPILSFIAIEGARGNIPYILESIKGPINVSTYNNVLLPCLLSILFLYALLNILIAVIKERKMALFVFGFISIILCLAEMVSMLILKQPFDITQIKILIDTAKQVTDWKQILTTDLIFSIEFLSPIVYLVVYYPLMGSFIKSLGFVSKKEKVIRIIFFVLLVISIILYSKSINKLPEAEKYLQTFFFALL